MKMKTFRALVAVVLVLTLVFNFSPIRTQATGAGLAALPVVGVGTVGVGAVAAICCILVLVGVMAGTSTNDLRKLAMRISDALPSRFTVESSVTDQTLVEAKTYKGQYYFSQDLVEAVNNYVYTGSVTGDATAATELPAVVKQAVFTQPASVSYLQALELVRTTNVNSYNYLVKYSSYCTRVNFASGAYQYVWSSNKLTTDSSGQLAYPMGSISVFVDSSGARVTGGWGDSGTFNSFVSTEITYAPTADLELDEIASPDVIDVSIGIHFVDGPDDDGDENTNKLISVLITNDLYELQNYEPGDMIGGGKSSSPDIVVDAETDKIIVEDGEIQSSYGRYVNVDAEAAIASMLVALGVSPGTHSDDFKALVSQIIDELPSSMITDYDSPLHGSYSMMTLWQYSGRYYVKKSTLQTVTDLLFEGSDSMEPVIRDGNLNVDLSVWPTYVDDVPESVRNSKAYNYILAAKYVYSGSTTRLYALSGSPFVVERSGSNCAFYCASPGRAFNNGSSHGTYASGSKNLIMQFWTGSSSTSLTYEIFERESSIVGDLIATNVVSDVSKLSYQYITVKENSKNIQMYPITLYSSIDDLCGVDQDEVQSGDDSKPDIVVDPETGTIIDGSSSTPQPDDEPDTTLPSVEVPDSPADPDTPEVDSGTTDGITVGGLLSTLYEWGSWLVDALTSPIEWLADKIDNIFSSDISWLRTQLKNAFNNSISWLSSSLLDGWETLTIWLKNGIVNGLGSTLNELFVPSEGLLAEKVAALRSRYSFIDGVSTSVEGMIAYFDTYWTQPPFVTIDLSNAPSGSWGDSIVYFVDFSFYEPYKPYVDNFLSGSMWAFFIWRVFVRLPGIIGGEAGYVVSVAAYEDDPRKSVKASGSSGGKSKG